MAEDSSSGPGAVSDDTVRSLATKLSAFAETLPDDDRAMLEHLLLTALRPLQRARLSADGLLSDAERDLLERLSKE